MRHNNYVIGMLFMLLFSTSCNDDFLETVPLTEISEVALWDDPNLVRVYINNIYLGIPEPMRRGRLTANLVDEADYRGNTASLNFNNCIINQDATPMWLSMYYDLLWPDFYKRIRYCNVFLENMDRINTSDDDLIRKMEGEVRFLRAYLYYNMIAIWGGVPLITKVYELSDDFEAPRNTYEECVNFVVDECNKAAELLPFVQEGNDRGRVTKGAAMALKSRTLLYAASILHNNSFTSYSNPELLGYTSGDANQRWRIAKDAAREVMDLGIYSLYKGDPDPGDSIAQNFIDYFLTQEFTSEDIWYKFFLEEKSAQLIGLYSGPNGYHGWGAQAPIADFVDAYEMEDGSTFDWSNPEHAANPYKNRDQRFYASILYEGAKWRQRPDDVIAKDPEGVIQVGTWEVWDEKSNSMTEKYGLDTRKGGIEEWNGSYTGYYMRKFVDPNKDVSFIEGGGGGYQGIPYRFFRYGEILLNYVEACIELGEYEEAQKYLNMIRKRAGQPDTKEVGEELKNRYRNERRIELAFEEHRIHDIRRWMIGPEAYKPAKRANVIYKLLPDKSTSKKPTITHENFQERSWNDKAYFMPIARDEINKNSALIQNPGY